MAGYFDRQPKRRSNFQGGHDVPHDPDPDAFIRCFYHGRWMDWDRMILRRLDGKQKASGEREPPPKPKRRARKQPLGHGSGELFPDWVETKRDGI